MKCLTLCLFLTIGLHPFHLSVTEILHNTQSNTLEISMKLFMDDLDNGIEKSGCGKMYLGTEKENENSDLFIYKYLLENFELLVDGKEVEFDFRGKEYDPEYMNVVWCYLEVKKVKKFSKLNLKNHILTEVFPDQQNIVHIKKNGKIKSLRMRKGYDNDEVEFE